MGPEHLVLQAFSWVVNGWLLVACFKGNFMVRMDFRTSVLHENMYLVCATVWTGLCLLDIDITQKCIHILYSMHTEDHAFYQTHSSLCVTLLAFPGSVMGHCSPFLTLIPATGLLCHIFTPLPAFQWQLLSRLLWGPTVCFLKVSLWPIVHL